jgi:hypothetical protein
MRQKLIQFGVQAAGNVVTIGVIVFLVVAWALSSPLIRLSDWLAGSRKEKLKTREKL